MEHFKSEEASYLQSDGENPSLGNQIKGKILSNILANKIYDMIEPTDAAIISRSDLPAKTKCNLLLYLGADPDQKVPIAASVVYDLLNCEKVSAKMNELKSAHEQEDLARKHLLAELETLPRQYHDIFLCLVLYQQAVVTDNRETKILADEFMRDYRERRII